MNAENTILLFIVLFGFYSFIKLVIIDNYKMSMVVKHKEFLLHYQKLINNNSTNNKLDIAYDNMNDMVALLLQGAKHITIIKILLNKNLSNQELKEQIETKINTIKESEFNNYLQDFERITALFLIMRSPIIYICLLLVQNIRRTANIDISFDNLKSNPATLELALKGA